MSRPEHSYAPQVFYDEAEARKYNTSSRMLNIQREITSRALELLNMGNDGPKLLLDVGCGSGLSGQVISKHGHTWIGLDISPSMLTVARESLDREEARFKNRSVQTGGEGDDEMEEEEEGDDDEEDDDAQEEDEDENEEMDEDEEDDDDSGAEASSSPTRQGPTLRGKGDVILHDMGQGLNFRSNMFDGCVSISAVQWLCNAYEKSHVPFKRLKTFFGSLYSILRRGARAVIQLYPETPQQMEMITSAAMSAGFTGGIVVDYPNSAKAKKFYLVLFAGGSSSGQQQQLPRGLGTTMGSGPKDGVQFERERARGKIRKRDDKNAAVKKSRDWIVKKKDRQRKQGREVRPDSKFTGRRRSKKF